MDEMIVATHNVFGYRKLHDFLNEDRSLILI